MTIHICKGCLIIVILLLSAIFTPAIAQNDIEERLDRLEARVDSILDLLGQYIEETPTYRIVRDSLNIYWGITSARGTVLDKGYFVINHNDQWKIPYWVAYYLSASNLQGNQSRTNDFRSDSQLPVGSRAELEDYRYSGFDRGHNAPAAAFKRSREAMSTTFLLSNMSPQTLKLNQRIWKKLEEQVRELVMAGGEAWIITGNVFLSSDSQFVSPTEFIGPNSVAVPTHCFKTILSCDDTGEFSMFAFLLPNQREHIPGTSTDYIITIDRLEEITEYDFFPNLPDEMEDSLESLRPDTWPR